MKDTKFRAWHKERKCMLRVRAITFNNNETIHPTEVYAVMTIDQDGNLEDNNYPGDVILMQYTGLKDEDDKEICEGDVLKYTRKKWYCPDHPDHDKDVEEICLVYWDDEKHGFCNDIRDETGRIYASGRLGFEDKRAEAIIIEIIGNIYENPELLKEKK